MDDKGSLSIEAALLVPLLFLLILAVFAYTYTSYTKAVVSEAARSGAREAAVRYDIPGVNYISAGRAEAQNTIEAGGLETREANISLRTSGGVVRCTVSYKIPGFVYSIGSLVSMGMFADKVETEATAELEPEYIK